MTFSQLILLSILPLGALAMLGFAHWDNKRHPPARKLVSARRLSRD